MLGSRLPSGCDSLCLRVSASRGRVAPSASRHGGISLASLIREAATAEPYQLSSILDYSGLAGNVNMEKNLKQAALRAGVPPEAAAPNGKRTGLPWDGRGCPTKYILRCIVKWESATNERQFVRGPPVWVASPPRGALAVIIFPGLGVAGVRPAVDGASGGQRRGSAKVGECGHH